MCKVPSIDSHPTWREKENTNTSGDTWHWQELLINLSPSKRSYKFGDTFQYKLNLWYVGIWGAGKTEIPGENLLRADRRTNNKLNPYVASILATLVGSECSLHCIIPAPTKLKRWFVGYFRFLIQKRIIFFLYFNNNKLPRARIDTFGYCAALRVRGPEFESQMWPQIFTNLYLYQNGQNTIFTWGLICSAI